ncbi:MAG: OsmC family protein [Polaromonas sp.]
MRNGIPAAGLSELAHEIKQHPEQGCASYGVNVKWLSGTRAQAVALPMQVGDQAVHRDFQWLIDEPKQMGGSNHAPNPQEYLLSGFGACMMVAYLVGASVMGIQLSQLDIEVRSELDIGGFLGVNAHAPVPLKGIRYVVRVAGDGTAEQFERLRETAQAHSPNAMSLATGVAVSGSVQLL